jgi:hypothetical protein
MAFKPHWRISFHGRIGGALGLEQFSCNFALAGQDEATDAVVPALLGPNDDYWTDLADDVARYFSDGASKVHADAVITGFKAARIGADGKYTEAPVERVMSWPGGGAGIRPPNSTACKVTLGTNGDLSRVKGGWYLPVPSMVVQADGRWLEADVESVEARTRDFINDVNNAPGINILGLRMAVASQGRFNKNGSQRVPPRNHVVRRVAVGRVPDTMRSRRNKLVELKDFRAVEV